MGVLIHWEVFDHILGFLSEDKATLGACSLVCRSAMMLSRKHLFRAVHLHPDNAKSLSELISSPRSFIVPFIYKLELHTDWCFEEIDSVMGILTELTQIKSLALYVLRWEDIGSNLQELLLSGFKEVVNLNIGAIFSTVSQFIDLVESFPRVVRLNLHCTLEQDITPEAASALMLDRMPLGVQPKHLDLPSCNCPRFFSCVETWLRTVDSLPVIEMVASPYDISPQTVTSILHLAESNLGYLSLDLPIDMDSPGVVAYCENLDLWTNSRISCLLVDNVSIGPQHDNLDAIPLLLSQIKSPHMVCFEFFVSTDFSDSTEALVSTTDDIPTLNHSTWTRIDDILSQPLFSKLKEVAVRTSGRSKDMIERLGRMYMKKCDARGILVIEPGWVWEDEDSDLD